MADRLVVIGADAAGMAAAVQARRRQPYLEIVALERGPWTSYSACGIPYLVGGEVGALEDLVVRSPDELRERYRIDVRTGHEVTGIDLASGQLEVRDHRRKRTLSMGWDSLHVATGSRPVRPALPGFDGDDVVGVQTLDDARLLLERVRVTGCRRVVVVGGGYVGLEIAEAFVRREMAVTLIDAGEHVMGTLDPDMSDRLLGPLRGLGIDVRLGTEVRGVEDGHVLTDDDGAVAADLVVLGIGVEPNAELAGDAGIELGPTGAIAVDRRQRTSAEAVYSAGDCAQVRHLVSGRDVHIALGTVANKTGRVAGVNLGGGYATFGGVVGTAITGICGFEVARTGLNEREVAEAGLCADTTTVETTARAAYLPDHGRMWVKLLAEVGTGRLLGAQILGEVPGAAQAAKRIDVIALALQAGLGVADLLDADLAYAPPVSSVWDPLQQAARSLSHAAG